MGATGTTGMAVATTIGARDTTPKMPIGTQTFDAAGNTWTYVKAGAAIAAKNAVMCNGSALGWDDVRPTSAANQAVVGVADLAFASGDYGFIQTDGIATALVANSTAVGSLLVSSAVAGVLALAAATDLVSRGIQALTTSASSATAGAVVNLL
jgi:hypothetical protein